MKSFKKLGLLSLVAGLLVVGGFISSVPKAEAAAGPNTITKTDVTPGNQPGTFTGVLVYTLHVANASVDTPDAILMIYATPSGSVVDTLVRLHFYFDSNGNGVFDRGDVEDVDLGASALFGSNDTGQWFDIGNVGVCAPNTSTIFITADGTGLADGGSFLLSIASIANVVMQNTAVTGGAPGANLNALTIDAVAPTVTAAVQSVTDALDQTVNVQSNEGTGNVYIILTGEPQVTVADLNAAFLANKGVKEAVITANTNVPLSTAGLTDGVYHAYAVDAAGNISTEGTNAITVAAAAPVFTPATNSTTANTDEILGLIGTTAVSSNTAIATTSISGGNIAITSVGVGTATITVSDGVNDATIAVTVDALGAITIGTITPYLSSNASLISVADQSIKTIGTGTQGSPKTASISVANTVEAIYVEDIVAATNDTPHLYSNSGFTTTAEPLDLAVGDTHAYIKVVVENGTDAYYDVTITRAAATTYAITDDTEDEPDRAKDISWKAEKYTDSNKSCSERLKLTIKGKNFDKDAEVFIGGKESSSVNVKNSKELTAKFCLEKLLNDKVDQKRKITVKNPDTDKTEADKQIDLVDLTSENEVAGASITSTQTSSSGDYDQKTKEGAKQIQEALNKLGYLDAENITSTFGSITMEAVKKFQSDNGIEATGFVGELTKAKLAEKLK